MTKTSPPAVPAIKPITARKPTWVRTVVQTFFFVLIALISLNHNLAKTGKGIPFLSNASLHAICPFGGVVTLFQYITSGTFVQKVHQASFILMIASLFMAILAGPVFCSWVCPLGSFQASMTNSLFRLSNMVDNPTLVMFLLLLSDPNK